MLSCLEPRLRAVSGDQLLPERDLGLHMRRFAAPGSRGSLRNSICGAPAESCVLRSCSTQLEFLLTCLSPFPLRVLIKPLSNLQPLMIINIPAPGRVASKDDPTG